MQRIIVVAFVLGCASQAWLLSLVMHHRRGFGPRLRLKFVVYVLVCASQLWLSCSVAPHSRGSCAWLCDSVVKSSCEKMSENILNNA